MKTLIFDSHCHIHRRENFLDLSQAIKSSSDECDMALCLVELAGSNWFEEVQSNPSYLPEFKVERIDSASLMLMHQGTRTLVIKAEQINTQERLEVIVVGCDQAIEEGEPLDHYLKKYSEDFLVVIPWGVGKWLGSRGQHVNRVIEESKTKGYQFALGDNGGRPSWWNIPQFSTAIKHGIHVLAGSDPLNVESYQKRVLAYGDRYKDVSFESARDWIGYIKNGNMNSERFGRLSSTMEFFFDQIGLRLKKFM